MASYRFGNAEVSLKIFAGKDCNHQIRAAQLLENFLNKKFSIFTPLTDTHPDNVLVKNGLARVLHPPIKSPASTWKYFARAAMCDLLNSLFP